MVWPRRFNELRLLGTGIVLLVMAVIMGVQNDWNFVWQDSAKAVSSGPNVFLSWTGLDVLQERLGANADEIALHVTVEPLDGDPQAAFQRGLQLRSTRVKEPLRIEVPPGRYRVRMRLAAWVTVVGQYQQPWMELGQIEVLEGAQRQEFELAVPPGVVR